jgi:ketosteroid isomerase-like protein
MTTLTSIAEQFFAASAAGDNAAIRALCSPDLVVRQNGGPVMGIDGLLALSAGVRRVAPDFRYENAVRAGTDTGFVEEHDACGKLADGTEFRMAVCVVATVENGLITSLREYLDLAAARPLGKALAAR